MNKENITYINEVYNEILKGSLDTNRINEAYTLITGTNSLATIKEKKRVIYQFVNYKMAEVLKELEEAFTIVELTKDNVDEILGNLEHRDNFVVLNDMRDDNNFGDDLLEIEEDKIKPKKSKKNVK